MADLTPMGGAGVTPQAQLMNYGGRRAAVCADATD
jgi:hypothetical protein